MAVPEERLYTIDDILNLPEGVRAELIDGQIYYKGAPNWKHQQVVGLILTAINVHIMRNNGKCRAFVSPTAVFLNEDDSTYLEPDVFVTCDPNKLETKGFIGVPDWAIEVVSPSSVTMDYVIKQNKYMMAGMREYWIVDLKSEKVVVVGAEDPRIEVYSFHEKVPSRVLEGLSIDFPSILQFL